MDLSALHGSRIAILLCTAEHPRVVTGIARYSASGDQPHALRIELDGAGQQDGRPAFVIRSDQWRGEVAPGTEYGCDYRIQLWMHS